MVQNLILSMSISGSLVLLFYMVLSLALKRLFSCTWRSIVLKISMVFFAIPFAYFKFYYQHFFKEVVPIAQYNAMESQIIDNANTLFVSNSDIAMGEYVKLLYLLAVISISFVSFKIFRYLYTRYIYLKHAREVPLTLFAEQIPEICAMKNVKLFAAQNCKMPMVFGIWEMSILIPEDFTHNTNSKENLLCLRHELSHVQAKDPLLKFLGTLLTAVHWFNPLCYLLLYEINATAEFCCDQRVIKNLNSEDEKLYCNLIIDMSKESLRKETGLLALCFSSKDLEITKRRILEMKLGKTKKSKVLTCIVGAAICYSAMLSTLAYTPPTVYKTLGNFQYSESELNAIHEFIPNGAEKTSKYYDPMLDTKILYDTCFVDEHGNVTEISETPQAKAICNHTYAVGTTQTHTRNSSGGCTLSYYNSKKCTKCGQVERGTLINQITFATCNH